MAKEEVYLDEAEEKRRPEERGKMLHNILRGSDGAKKRKTYFSDAWCNQSALT